MGFCLFFMPWAEADASCSKPFRKRLGVGKVIADETSEKYCASCLSTLTCRFPVWLHFCRLLVEGVFVHFQHSELSFKFRK